MNKNHVLLGLFVLSCLVMVTCLVYKFDKKEIYTEEVKILDIPADNSNVNKIKPIDKVVLNSKEYKRLSNLNTKEKEVLYRSIILGKEQGIMLAAIAWQESQFGNLMKNDKDGIDGSYGYYQVQLHYANKRNPDMNKEEVKEALLTDMEFQVQEALATINGFTKNKKHSNHTLLKRYNGGYSDSKQSIKYADNVIWKMKVIRAYIEQDHIQDELAMYDTGILIAER